MIYNGLKVGYNGPEETASTKQGFGQHIAVGAANGWRTVGGAEDGELGRCDFSQCGGWGNSPVQTFSYVF